MQMWILIKQLEDINNQFALFLAKLPTTQHTQPTLWSTGASTGHAPSTTAQKHHDSP